MGFVAEQTTMDKLSSAIYSGSVRHRRFTPREHRFSYDLMQWWLALDELEHVGRLSKALNTHGRFAPLQFRASDYLRGHWGDADNLTDAVLNKINQLAPADGSSPLHGRVFFLGNLRCWGVFFSPINCYFLQQGEVFTHMLAEVSNTPWNERHYYLVDLAKQIDTDKAFHVSPFNPMDMVYQWKINQPSDKALVHIGAHRNKQLVFDATMALQRQPMNRKQILRVLKSYPAMSFKIVWGIYWQALKLFMKRVPFYGHAGSKN